MDLPVKLSHINSNFALRIINLVLIVIMILELPSLFYNARLFEENPKVSSQVSNSSLPWSEVDILSPPALNDTILEAMRMNEFLATPTFKCRRRILVGSKRDKFHVCADPKFLTSRDNSTEFQRALLITGRSNSVGNFEQALNVSKWTLFLPQQNTIVEKMEKDIELHYLIALEEDKYFPIGKVIEETRNVQEFELAKLDIYSQHLDHTQLLRAPERVEQILVSLRTRQLLLVVEVDEKSAKEVLPVWYRLLYRLFFKWGYALVGAESNNACGVDLEFFGHCEYRISFVKANLHEVESAPVFGLGSPMEEKLRLLNYLHHTAENCSDWQISNGQLPIPCMGNEMDDNKKFNSMAYFRYRLMDDSDARILAEEYETICERIVLFYPEPSQFGFPKSIQLISDGISPNINVTRNQFVPAHNIDIFWKLRSFDELISAADVKPFERNLLAFDLDGGEWTVLEAVTRPRFCALLRNFQQILFRLRLWAIEEVNNYRRFYLWFLRLEECGFAKTISHWHNSSTLFVTYKRIKFI